MKDYIVRATAANAQIRAFACTTQNLVETARSAHNTSPVVTAALGRLLTAGSMMGSMMKGEKDVLTLQIHGSGPVQGLTVTADSHPDKPETDQGADTEHGLYLLSVDEVLEYFPEPEDRVCYATDYLVSEFENTIHVNGLYEGGRCDWWLRTALHNYSSGAFIANIDPNGNVNASTHNCRHALRPVCWIQLEG